MVPSPSSENRSKKMKPTTTTTPSPPLRRSERNRNVSSSNNSHSSTSRTLDSGNSSNRNVKIRDSRIYRAILTQNKKKDRLKETNSEDKSTPEDSNTGEDKIDECSKGNSLECKEVFEDCLLSEAKDMRPESRSSEPVKELLEKKVTLGSAVVQSNSTTHETSEIPERVQSDCHEEETSQTVATRESDSNESLIRKCVRNEKGQNLTPSKRKSTVVDNRSDVSPRVVDDDNCNLIVDADPERLSCNVVETSGPPSKRIRGINNVDQAASRSNDEKSCSRSKEEKPRGNSAETEKIRKQQRSLHRSLKPEIAKLCEILLLPDNVKSMAIKFLEYTMNNYKIGTESVSVLQAFQLSLCWTAASLLSHKLDTEASLILAKRHLNFDCKKDAVDEIYAMLGNLKDKFLLLTGNSIVNCSSKASESSNRVHSNTDITSDAKLTKKDISGISKNIKGQKRDQWRKLLRMQQENKLKLEKDFETEKADLARRRKIEWTSILPSYLVMTKEKQKEKCMDFASGYNKICEEMRRQYQVRLQALETEQLEAKQKLRESSAPDELSSLVSSMELETPHNDPKLLMSDEVPETSHERATASEMSRDAAVGFPSTVRSTDYPENAASLNSLSTGQISDGGLDGAVSSKPCSSSSPSNGRPATISLLNSPSSTQQVPDRVLLTITDAQIPVMVPELSRDAVVGLPSTVRTTDYPENAAPLISSSTDQISDGGLDGVGSSSPCIFPSPGDGPPATSSVFNLPSSKPQVPDSVLPAITDGQIPVTVAENSHEEAECELRDNMEVNDINTPDNQDVVQRTIAENTLTQETSVSRALDPIEPPEQVQVEPLLSVELPLSPVHILPANQPNHVSMVIEPPEQVQLPSSNQDFCNLPSATGGEDQEGANEDDLSSQIPEAMIEVQNQAVEQPASDLEVDSHSRQVVPPVSNMVLDSLVAGGLRAQLTDTRNMSTHRVINTLPIQAPAQPATRNVRPYFHDPLSYEFERLRKLSEQNVKNYEDMKLQLRCNFEKEAEELRRKYEMQMKEIEVDFQKTKKDYDTQSRTVYVHKILADTFKKANFDPMFSGASGMLQGILPYDAGFSQLLSQPSRQQNATRAPLVASSSFRGPPATTFQNSHASTSSHTMVPPPTQASYNTSGNISGFSARIPHSNSISSPSGNQQAGGERRAPPSHRMPYRPSTSVSASGLSGDIRAPAPPLPSYRPSTSLPASSHSGEIRAPAPHLPPYRPSTSVPPSTHSGEIRAPAPHLPPYRPSTSVPPSTHSGEIRAPAPHLLMYRPSTSVPPSTHSGEIRAPAPHLLMYRPSTSVPPSTHSGEIRAPAPHLPPYRPSTSVPASTHSGEIRTPAPHLPPYRPSTSVPASSLSGNPVGMPSQPAPSNSSASSVSFSQWLPRLMPAISQFGPHMGHGHGNTGGLPTPNVSILDMRMNSNSQSSINLQNTRPRMSDHSQVGASSYMPVNSAQEATPNTGPRMSDHSQVGASSCMPVNSAQEATPSDVVYLSDDD